jgi:large subunit ribosomal protein L38
VSKGELIVPYLQPIPPKGTGHHRHTFVLYKQEKKLNFNEYKVTDSTNLDKRSFHTFDFYRKHQDDITPAGLSFFQASWDESLTDFYHKVLKIKEPIYDYDYPEAYLKPETHYPHRQPFNIYLDRFADPKDVNKRFLEEKLAKTHPFEGPEPPLRYPNAQYLSNEPSWLKTEIRKKNLRIGRINDTGVYSN